MKKMALILCAAMLLTTAALAADRKTAAAASDSGEWKSGYVLQVDGKDTGSRVCIMVPLRSIAEKLGFTVKWDNGTVLVDSGSLHTTITIGEDRYQLITSLKDAVGATGPFSLGAAPCVVNGVTYVPMELISALLGSQDGAVRVEDGALKIVTNPSDSGTVGGDAQIPNPWTDCGTLAEAEKLAGTAAVVPDSIGGSDSRSFRAIAGSLLEVIYQKDGQETGRVRKAAGTEDISGDYTVYDKTETITVGQRRITLKGGSGTAALAVWTDGGSTYAVSVAGGLSTGEMSALVEGIR